MEDPGPSSSYYSRFASTSAGPVRPPSPPSSPILDGSPPESLATHQSQSLYAILNLPTTASEHEIRDRYRSLASTFHPDRQRDDTGRQAAHGRFQEIQRAYEVLTDRTRRTVYDMFGEEGLRTSWEVGVRAKTTEEMRKQFQRQAHAKKQLEAEALVKSRGDLSVVLDARAVFVPPSAFPNPAALDHGVLARLGRVRPGRLSLKHSFESALGERTQLVWAGQMVSGNGRGGGNVIGTVKHQFSPKLWVEVGSSLLQSRVATAKMTYAHDENTFVTVNAVQQTALAPPRLSVTLGRRLYAETTGFLTFKTGFFNLGPWGQSLSPLVKLSDQSALSVGLTTARRAGTGWTVETQAGLLDSHISADYSWKVLGLKIKVGTAVGSVDNISGFVDGEGRMTEHVRMGVMVQAEFGGGVIMRLRFARLGQKISLPILLAPNLNPYILLGALAIPAASYAAVYRWYLIPRKRRRIQERVKELREEHAEYIRQKRQEALEACSLLERPTATKVQAERQRHGLIIVSALYGRAASFTARGIREHHDDHEETVVDVTLPVQALVQDSKLVIPGGRAKHNILGFYDPCIGENKKLRVRYLFRDKLHEVTVDDVSLLRIPMAAHALEGQ